MKLKTFVLIIFLENLLGKIVSNGFQNFIEISQTGCGYITFNSFQNGGRQPA